MSNEAKVRTRCVGRPWLALCLALAIHVADEARTGFLPVYNDAVRALSEYFPFVPAPHMTLALWLGITMTFVASMVALLPSAYRGARWMRIPTIGVALIALANVIGHVGGSFLAGSPMPGVYSTPLLGVAGVYALMCAWRTRPGIPSGS